MTNKTAIFWFRQDLRLHDNPGLIAAAEFGTVIPIFILDDEAAGDYAMGAASRWWLHYSLLALNKQLKNRLQIYCGNAMTILKELCQQYDVDALFWNRCYEPWRIAQDTQIKKSCRDAGITCESFNGSLLWEPWQVLKQDGTPYKVFTPYYRKGCLQKSPPRQPLPKPRLSIQSCDPFDLDTLNLLPTIAWDEIMKTTWEIGEVAALKRLKHFVGDGLAGYKEGRNFPAKPHVSKLSAYLHFGEISPNQVWHSVAQVNGLENDCDNFQSELGWREFSYYLLYHSPDLPSKNFQEKFNRFPWEDNPEYLRRWQRGNTGYPIVDAGMRELWQTGHMHNRIRMVVASFLVKNCLIHWHHGRDWFWDCLVDADLASNSASWQWVAGSGADAAPYFRIFNPITQGEKFDPDGEYTRYYVPELENCPNKYLFKPWEAPDEILKQAGIILGEDYPHPMVDVKTSREAALAAYQKVR